MSLMKGMPTDAEPHALVDPRFVSEVQAHRYWKRSRSAGWRIRITHETVFHLPLIGRNPVGRLVAFYLVDYGPDRIEVSEEYAEVLFTMHIDDFLFSYEPEYPCDASV